MEIGIVRPVAIVDEMRTAYLDYAMSVIVSRALPDARDGLKPVQRRILYAMFREGLLHNTRYSKCAGIVGEALKKYHPHGDSSVYDALVRLAQGWNMRYPLVDGQGNFGCFTGDTKIKLLDGTERSFAELAQLPYDEIFHVYSVDKKGRIVVGEGRSSRITRRNAEIIELTFDDGSRVRCTPDHKFMLRDGSWQQAQHLTIDDSLTAGYFDTAKVYDSPNEYLRVLQPHTGEYEFVHRLADTYNETKGLAKSVDAPFVRHHKNFNRLDNRPTNIERMKWSDHRQLHASHLQTLWQDEAFRAAQREGIQAYYETHPEAIEQRRQRLQQLWQDENYRAKQSEVSRISWQSPERRAKYRSAIKKYYANHPEVLEAKRQQMAVMNQDASFKALRVAGVQRYHLNITNRDSIRRKSLQISKTLRERFQNNPELAEMMAERAREQHRQNPDHARNAALKLWKDPMMIPLHREKILRQWEDPEFRAAHLEGRKREYTTRININPNVMAELTERAKEALLEKWQDADYKRQVMRTKIAGYVARLIAEFGRDNITPELYMAQRSANWIPSIKKALTYFDNHADMVAVAATHNHRVVSIHRSNEYVDVYDITVNEHHNFLLANGVCVSNSIDDPPAAYRYTEARLTALAEEILYDIDKETVDFKPNFDGEYQEPTVLPAKLPNLLLNGSSGIAVGMATNIPPHNLGELCDGIMHLIENSECTVEDLMKIIPGPDFPTGGAILGNEGIINAYSTGRGRILMRAKAHIEEAARGAFNIVVTEFPYQVNKSRVIERIAELVKEKRLEGIRDVRDESDRSGTRMVVILKQDAQPKKVLNQLFKYTSMQTTFGANMLALIEEGKQPRVLTLKRALQEHIDHRQIVIRRRTEFELRKARARAHILEGLKIALDNLDEVIQTIRASRTTESARNNLMKGFKLSEIQAQAILEMQLRRLAGLERKKIEDEYQEVIKVIGQLEDILGNTRLVLEIIKADLAELKEKYGDARRTRIIAGATGDISTEDLIPDMPVLVTVTDRGYIKKVPADTYRVQHRGGRGIKGMTTKDDDVVNHILRCNTLNDLLFFTNRGKVYQLKAHEVPDASRTAKGLPLVNLISLDPGEFVTSLIAVPDFDQAEYLVMATVKGRIKRTILNEYSSVRSNGLIAIGLDEGDELRWVRTSNGDEDIFMTTRMGQTIRFAQDDVRSMGRPASGVIGVRMDDKDEVVGMGLAREDAQLLVVTSKGMGKRTALDEYPRKGRGGQGVITMKLKPGDFIAAAHVNQDDETVTIITRNGVVMRTRAANISQYGRSTQGVNIINLDAKDKVAAVSCEASIEDPNADESDAAASAGSITITA